MSHRDNLLPEGREERRRALASRLLAAQAVPQRLSNASVRAPYTPPAVTQRAGADDHRLLQSRGV